MNLIDKAIRRAATAHDGQFRKASKLPYISHPFAVGMILAQHGCTEAVIAAGILHDTVEDTDVTLEQIEAEFGSEVAALVAGASEPDKSLSWEERKTQTIDYLKTATLPVRQVVCADKLHNASSILADLRAEGEQVWDRFNRGKQEQHWYYTNIVASLKENGSFAMVDELEQVVGELFGTSEVGLS